MIDTDILIVGGGASGLACACMLMERAPGLRVVVCEKQPRAGKKLIATGNGTCNISNINSTEKNYYHGDSAFAADVISRFSYADSMNFFERIGVDTYAREDGRIYPVCGQASAVLDCLRMFAVQNGVQILCDAEICGVSRKNGGYTAKIAGSDEGIAAKTIIVSTGGASSPSLGGGNGAYDIPLALGHSRTKLAASIVQIKTDTGFVKSMKGIRCDCGVEVLKNDKRAAYDVGEVLFTEYGLSGPAVMSVSRIVGEWEIGNRRDKMSVRLDFLPDWTFDEVVRSVDAKSKIAGRSCGDLLLGLLNKRVGQTLIRSFGKYTLSDDAISLGRDDIAKIAERIKGFKLDVLGTRGLFHAQVTAGGVICSEVDSVTLESKKNAGMYLCGEVLDVDGDCGGFNLQWAWSSAGAVCAAILKNGEKI